MAQNAAIKTNEMSDACKHACTYTVQGKSHGFSDVHSDTDSHEVISKPTHSPWN